MNQIDRLLLKVRKLKEGEGKYIQGFIDYFDNLEKFVLTGSVWDGKNGLSTLYSEHDTIEEAQKAFDEVVARYPNATAVVFSYDYGLED